MLFRYEGKPARLARLFKSFRGMAPRLRAYGQNYLRAVLLASLLYAVLSSVALYFMTYEAAFAFWFLFLAGTVYLLLAWGYSRLFQKYPNTRQGTSSRIATGIFLSVGAVFGFSILAGIHEDLPALPEGGRLQVIFPWLLAGLGVFVISRWIVWLRMRSEFIQEFELDFLQRLLVPLLNELPEETACSLSCNPFKPMWSEAFSTATQGSRRLDTSDDVLLDFKAKLGEGHSLVLQTLTRRVDKHKVRPKKTKYKGTKHRIGMICRLQHPALSRLSESELGRLNQVCEGLGPAGANYTTTVRRDLAAGKLVAISKSRISGNRELDTNDLPDFRAVLAMVRSITAFAATLKA